MIDLRHTLAMLGSRMPWQQIEASVAHLFSRKAHAGVAMPDLDFFGEAPAPLARKSIAGRLRVPMRTMIARVHPKNAFNLSDEAVAERLNETPRWQYFSGQSYYEKRLPRVATTLVKFRRMLGEEGVEELLAQTVNLAVSLELTAASALATVMADSTAQSAGIELKQTLIKESRVLRFKAGGYAHAKQFKRMHRVIKRQSTVLGRLAREIERNANVLSTAMREALDGALTKARRIADQSRSRKNTSGASKLYAWHAPEVECIAKAKSRTPYEFGV